MKISADNRAFTLVEIMIVVAVVALLAAIAIPNLLRARLNANEAAAISALRTISTACESFRAAQTPMTYPASLVALGSLAIGGSVLAYIDDSLASAAAVNTARQGYYFVYTLINANQYTCVAIPAVYRASGTRSFFVDETGVIRGADKAGQGVPAIVTDPVVG